jgi:hypothetical protein
MYVMCINNGNNVALIAMAMACQHSNGNDNGNIN